MKDQLIQETARKNVKLLDPKATHEELVGAFNNLVVALFHNDLAVATDDLAKLPTAVQQQVNEVVQAGESEYEQLLKQRQAEEDKKRAAWEAQGFVVTDTTADDAADEQGKKE